MRDPSDFLSGSLTTSEDATGTQYADLVLGWDNRADERLSSVPFDYRAAEPRIEYSDSWAFGCGFVLLLGGTLYGLSFSIVWQAAHVGHLSIGL